MQRLTRVRETFATIGSRRCLDGNVRRAARMSAGMTLRKDQKTRRRKAFVREREQGSSVEVPGHNLFVFGINTAK